MIDLTFNNPLKRSLATTEGDEKSFAIESARLLVNYIFDEDPYKRAKTVLEERILMQAVPFVL